MTADAVLGALGAYACWLWMVALAAWAFGGELDALLDAAEYGHARAPWNSANTR